MGGAQSRASSKSSSNREARAARKVIALHDSSINLACSVDSKSSSVLESVCSRLINMNKVLTHGHSHGFDPRGLPSMEPLHRPPPGKAYKRPPDPGNSLDGFYMGWTV